MHHVRSGHLVRARTSPYQRSMLEKISLAVLEPCRGARFTAPDGFVFAGSADTPLAAGHVKARLAIGRALALNPHLLICDEPVSALDVSVQAQILNLLEDLKKKYDLTIIFIAHDLGVVRAVSDNVLVMYLGKVCEFGDSVEVYDNPAHPYTRALLDSVPLTDPDKGFAGPALQGDIPSPLRPPPPR